MHTSPVICICCPADYILTSIVMYVGNVGTVKLIYNNM